MLSFFIFVPFLSGGCSGDADTTQAPPGPGVGTGAGGPAGPGPASNPGIRQIMGKLNKGPSALTLLIKSELAQDPPPWDIIQGQTKEYACPDRRPGKLRSTQRDQGFVGQADLGLCRIGRGARQGRIGQGRRGSPGCPWQA